MSLAPMSSVMNVGLKTGTCGSSRAMRSSVVYPLTAGFSSSTVRPAARHRAASNAGNAFSGVVPVPMVNESPRAR